MVVGWVDLLRIIQRREFRLTRKRKKQCKSSKSKVQEHAHIYNYFDRDKKIPTFFFDKIRRYPLSRLRNWEKKDKEK